MKRKKRNGGFTLVEISVTMVIVSIVMVAVVSIFFTVNNLFAHSATKAEVKQLGDNVFQYLSKQLTYCTHLQVLPGDDTTTQRKYANEYSTDPATGHLFYKNGEAEAYDFYGDDFYKDCTLRITANVMSTGHVELTVTILKKGEEAYQTGSTIELINLTLASTLPEGMVDTLLTDPFLILDYTEQLSDGNRTPIPSQMKEYVLEAFSDFQKDREIYNSYAWNDPRKADKLKEIQEKYGVTNAATFRNDQMRDYVRNHYYGGTWPDIDLGLSQFSVENPNQSNLYVRGELKDIAPLELQFHAANIPNGNEPEKMSIVLYAVKKGPANDNNHSGWRPLVIYNPYDKYWYTPYPTTGSTKLGKDSDFIVASARPEDKAYYDAVVEKWNPLK